MVAVAALVIVALLLFARRAEGATVPGGRSASFLGFAESIAVAEGYGLPGAIPTVRNNPGDLKLSGGVITTFPTIDAGWEALYHQLELIRDGESAYYNTAMTIREMANVWTTTQQDAWAGNVVRAMNNRGFSVTLSTRLSDIL